MRLVLALVAACLGMAAMVLALRVEHPLAAASCHWHRTAQRIIVSKQLIDLDIPDAEWPALRKALRKFARDQGMSFRDDSRTIPGEVNAMAVSLCTADMFEITVLWNHWLTTHAHDLPGRGLPVALYADVPTEQWQRVGRDLFAALEGSWPGHVRFVDRDGYLTTDRPDYIR